MRPDAMQAVSPASDRLCGGSTGPDAVQPVSPASDRLR